MSTPAPAKTVDVVIVGGGVCGVLAAHRCLETALTYYIVDRQCDFGGVWASLANQHSHLQVNTATAMPNNVHYPYREENTQWHNLQAFEAMYRWHDKYPLGPDPLAKVSGPGGLHTLRRVAEDAGLYQNTMFGSSVLSVKFLNHMDR